MKKKAHTQALDGKDAQIQPFYRVHEVVWGQWQLAISPNKSIFSCISSVKTASGQNPVGPWAQILKRRSWRVFPI